MLTIEFFFGVSHFRRKHTDTSHGSGINISSNWVCLAFLLATAGMAQPEKIANMM